MENIESTVSAPRQSEAALYHERQAKRAAPKAVKLDEYYLKGDKVVRKTLTPSGNCYSVYIGTKSECDKAGVKYKVG